MGVGFIPLRGSSLSVPTGTGPGFRAIAGHDLRLAPLVGGAPRPVRAIGHCPRSSGAIGHRSASAHSAGRENALGSEPTRKLRAFPGMVLP